MDRALEEEEFDKHISIKEKDLDGNPTEEMKKFMSDMRNYCAEGLQFTNQMEIPIYLVSNWYPERFEFPELIIYKTYNLQLCKLLKLHSHIP